MKNMCIINQNIAQLAKNKSDIYIIFYSKWCPYSINALNLLRKKNKYYEAYAIDSVFNGLDELLKCLIRDRNKTKFNKMHKTRPIIFHKGKFIGGFDDLANYL